MKVFEYLGKEELKYYKDLFSSSNESVLKVFKKEITKGINQNEPPFRNEEQKTIFYKYKEINNLLIEETAQRIVKDYIKEKGLKE